MTGAEPLSERALRRLLALGAEGEPPAPPAPDPAAILPARYRVRGELGRGGMGVVYEAHDTQLDRLCAVKLLTARAFADDDLRRRFLREAQAAARLRHPHIAAIHDAAADYISMQLVTGAPLDAIDRGERRLLVELRRVAARAGHHAHEPGLGHRVRKPSHRRVEGRP
ncbi:MAG: protein kinase, partial [Planctomycetota bacterium]